MIRLEYIEDYYFILKIQGVQKRPHFYPDRVTVRLPAIPPVKGLFKSNAVTMHFPNDPHKRYIHPQQKK
ncbi:hypothetical protein CDAR_187191 [Caerostris darwini]|uniref:Uncharacterized protein n=1 Tax=Caerostris darwini TaxID=1538125 RepID=A0AAV4P1J4_9ARAC|nr:hypothetical protein CDAR_187191 [Caerostris darwini]